MIRQPNVEGFESPVETTSEDSDYSTVSRQKRSLLQESDGADIPVHESESDVLDNLAVLRHNDTDDDNVKVASDDLYEAAVVFGRRELVLTNLKHFHEYIIEVYSTYTNQ